MSPHAAQEYFYMFRSTIRPIFVCLTLATVTAILPAQAGSDQAIVEHVTVDYRDLNLQTTAGAEVLVRRIAEAAKRACGGRPHIGVMFGVVKSRFESCVANAEQSAVSKVDKQVVTAAFARKRTGFIERVATR
jgi:UrcA family protein